MEKIINKYLKIEPIEYKSFIRGEKETYEEVGKVIAKDEALDIPIGSMVWFDSFMAKKYPTDDPSKFQWFVHIDEIVKYEIPEVS